MDNDENMDLMLSDEELKVRAFYRKMLNLMKPCLVHKN